MCHQEHLLHQRCVPSLDFLFGGCMSSRKVVGLVVVLQKQWLEVSQGVSLAEEPPNTFLMAGATAVKLVGFKCCKLLDEWLVDDQSLVAVHPWILVRMLANALLQEIRHLEMWIAEQGRNANNGGEHLGKEGSTAVAKEQVGLLLVNDGMYVLQCHLGMQR